VQRKKRNIISESLRPPNPMIGFGLLGMMFHVQEKLPIKLEAIHTFIIRMSLILQRESRLR